MSVLAHPPARPRWPIGSLARLLVAWLLGILTALTLTTAVPTPTPTPVEPTPLAESPEGTLHASMRERAIRGQRLPDLPDLRSLVAVRTSSARVAVGVGDAVVVYARSPEGWRLEQRIPTQRLQSFAFDDESLVLTDDRGIRFFSFEEERWVAVQAAPGTGAVAIDGPRAVIQGTEGLAVWRRDTTGWAKQTEIRTGPWRDNPKERQVFIEGRSLWAIRGALNSEGRELTLYVEESPARWVRRATFPVRGGASMVDGRMLLTPPVTGARGAPSSDPQLIEAGEAVLARDLDDGVMARQKDLGGAVTAATSDLALLTNYLVPTERCNVDLQPGCQHGVVYVLRRSRLAGGGTAWEIATPLAGQAAPSDLADAFGAVTLNEGTLAVIAQGERRPDPNAIGQVYVFSVEAPAIVASDPGLPQPPRSGTRQRLEGWVTSDELNVREAPSVSAPVVRQLRRGAPIVVTGQADGWLRVEDGGWVFYAPQWVDLERPVRLLQSVGR